MSWKRNLTEGVIWSISQTMTASQRTLEKPDSIFVLRNNDLGDLLVITPLFEALRRKFPDTHIVAGVGHWNVETLKLNPYISEILVINAPWHNKFVPSQSLGNAIKYILFSDESQELARRKFDIGIDILGSQLGSLLMMRAGIPYRLGVQGYAGGHSAVQQYVKYNQYEHVGRSALRFAELLGATELPECRPQISLSLSERETGECFWLNMFEEAAQQFKRIVISPGGGFIEKCWPLESYVTLVKMLSAATNLKIMIVGGKQDRQAGEQIVAASNNRVQSLAGELALRETFSLVAAADLVVCNSSMLMHAAAAFSVPTVVLLGDYFSSTKQHAAQWGYVETCHNFGKEEGDRQEIYTAVEVFELIHNMFRA